MIFGVGSYGQHVGLSLIESGYKISYFVDNDSEKWGKFVNGIPIPELFIAN